MPHPRYATALRLAGTMICCAGVAYAQTYPSKPVRVLTAEVGGGTDVVARLVAQELSNALGQQAVVENHGGNAAVSATAVARSAPDGYTLLLYSNGVWVLPLLQSVSYDPVKDLAPIALLATSPNILAVHPSLPVKSARELIALAKARPGELNYASGATGSSNHLAAELFKVMAGVNIVRIAYKGAGPAMNDLIGGQVQLTMGTAGSVVPHVKSGRLRALAVTSARPSALFPALPTVAASGVPGYEAVTIYGMYAPAKTPAAVVNRLSEDTARLLARANMKEKFFSAGMETVGGAPEQLAATLKSEMIKWSAVIKAAGIRVE